MANRVIEKGLVEGGEVKEAERFLTGLGLVQYFKCCAFGHIAKHCRVSPQCRHCAQSHKTRNCTQKEKSVCPNCVGKGKDSAHKAWSETCPLRMKTRAEHQERYNTRPYKYPTEVKPDRRPLVTMTEPPKSRGPGHPKGSQNRPKAPAQTEWGRFVARTQVEQGQGEVMEMEVDSTPEPSSMSRPSKRARQTTLSFGTLVEG